MCPNAVIRRLPLQVGLYLFIVQRLAAQKLFPGWIVLCAGGVPLFLHHERRFIVSVVSSAYLKSPIFWFAAGRPVIPNRQKECCYIAGAGSAGARHRIVVRVSFQDALDSPVLR